MTEYKKLPEQARDHHWAVTEADPTAPHAAAVYDASRSNRRQWQPELAEQRWHQEYGRRQRESVGTPINQHRTVTFPPTDPAHAGTAFVERQRRRRERSQRRTNTADRQVQYVARTLAQTGTRASSGRIPAVRRPLPYQQSPIPERSRRQKPTPNLLLRLLSFLVVSAIVVVLISFLLTNSAFRITQVTVVGTRNGALIQRIQAMGMRGQNIFLLNVTGLTAQIDAQPEVASADLSKQWPNQLTVTIQERIPVLLWQSAQGTFSVDNQGMVIAPASATPGANRLQTVIEVPQQASNTNSSQPAQKKNAAAPLRPGMWLNQTEVTFAASILTQLPRITGISSSSFKLYYDGTIYSSTTQAAAQGYDSRGSFRIDNIVDGWTAYLGTADDANSLSNRLQELHAILDLAQQQQETIATIDLRYGWRPVFTLQQ